MVIIMADVFADLEPSIPLNTSQALCPESPSVSLMRQLLSVRLCFSGDKAPAGVHGLSGVGLRAGAQVSDAGVLLRITQCDLPPRVLQALWGLIWA